VFESSPRPKDISMVFESSPRPKDLRSFSYSKAYMEFMGREIKSKALLELNVLLSQTLGSQGATSHKND
jgi:hypothetical protein